ncbi:MAG: hypothetical protein ACHQRJ_11820 [Alphaproteobacteria bacterium]
MRAMGKAAFIVAMLAAAYAGCAGLAGAARAQGAATPGVLASAQFSDDPDLRCDITEVKRLSGDVLIVRFRLVDTQGQSGGGLTASTTPKQITWSGGWNEFYVIDPAENKKYQVLTDSEGKYIADIRDTYFKPGDQRLFWAKFPAPPATSTKVSVTIAKFAPFDDVPVAQ